MNVIAVNGSPRKTWNTHMLLEKALEGAKAAGADTELIHLCDIDYRGCISCFACKKKDGPSVGKCALNDGLKPLLEKIAVCDALILGSPIYFGEVTGMMRSFLERLFFQYTTYDKDRSPLFERRIQTAFIYSMNVPEQSISAVGYDVKFNAYEVLLERFLGPSRTVLSTETLQVHDYDKYGIKMFEESERKSRRDTMFPLDCQKAFDIGVEMAKHEG